MFADSLLECAPKTEPRCRVAVPLSFALQFTAMAFALVIPLLRLERLPHVSTVPVIAMSVHHAEATATAHDRSAQNAAFDPVTRFVIPGNFPRTSPAGDRNAEAPEPSLPFFANTPDNPWLITTLLNPTSAKVIHLAPSPLPSRPLRISTMEPGSLIRRLQPVYPEPAKRAGIQGPVVLKAIIAKDGSIEQLQVVSGNPLLIAATLQAVREWHYRPYVLNGAPVEVETTIIVTFTLNPN
jgi:periplasmic protein TonB